MFFHEHFELNILPVYFRVKTKYFIPYMLRFYTILDIEKNIKCTRCRTYGFARCGRNIISSTVCLAYGDASLIPKCKFSNILIAIHHSIIIRVNSIVFYLRLQFTIKVNRCLIMAEF